MKEEKYPAGYFFYFIFKNISELIWKHDFGGLLKGSGKLSLTQGDIQCRTIYLLRHCIIYKKALSHKNPSPAGNFYSLYMTKTSKP